MGATDGRKPDGVGGRDGAPGVENREFTVGEMLENEKISQNYLTLHHLVFKKLLFLIRKKKLAL